jgi:hypothetical protein
MNKLLPLSLLNLTDWSTDMRAGWFIRHEDWAPTKSTTAGGVAIEDSAKRKGEEQTSSSYF